MAEPVVSAVVGEVVSAAASFLTGKYEEFTEVPNKIQRLEWKLLKIQSAIRESNQYDIENQALRKMQQELMDVAQEGNQVLQEFNNASSAAEGAELQRPNQAVAVQNPIIVPDTQRLDQAVVVQNPTIEQEQTQCPDEYILLLSGQSLSQSGGNIWLQLSVTSMFSDFVWYLPFLQIAENMTDRIRHYGRDLISKIREIQKLNRILERVERLSGDINDFLEMLRHQKRKRDRRRRYRPYKSFLKLTYLELAQDALGYWWVHVSWMQILVPKIAAFVETKSKFELKAAGTKLSGVAKYCLM